MAGRGPAAKDPESRRRTNVPERGEWHAMPGIGWQHGDLPKPPTQLRRASRDAWTTWFQAWYAAHWRPEDVPALRQVIRLYDAVERGELTRASELRQAEDNWGITPKGQQDRRWSPPWMLPKPEEAAPTPEPTRGRFAHLKVVNE